MHDHTVGILLFDEVDVLDFTGPLEVFTRTRTTPGVESRRNEDSAPFRVCTVTRDGETITASGGLKIVPDHGFANAPLLDILVVPGGFGTRALLDEREVTDWIATVSGKAPLTTSVCTGSLLLAAAGLLEGRRATTHWCALDLLAQRGDVTVIPDVRFVDDQIITSAGVAAGIDMAFHVVERLCGPDVANETARYIDYPRART